MFVAFYLSILFLQRKAEEAYSLTSTLTAAIIPGAKTMGSKNDVLNWIDSVVTTSWVEPQCGDGRCEAPFEFPEYGRFGCKADCNEINSQMNITKIQIDLYYNFSHPKGSVSPIDLMNDAKWNLCPLEMDENIGPKKIFHGADCYYEEDQGFEDQVGHIIRKIDDVPDGDWTIVVKKDIFLKVAGAVRPRVNVTKEATHKRLLLAAHYAQTHRKIELNKYNQILSDLAETNATHAHDKINITFLQNSQNYNNTWKSERDGWNKTLQAELTKEANAANSSNATLVALMEGNLANSTNTKEEAMIWRKKYRENNDTMIDWALRANGYCQTNFPDLMNSTRYKYGFNHSNAWTADFFDYENVTALGNTYPDDDLFNVSMLTNTTCRCVPVAGIDECFCYEAGLSDVFNATEGTCDKCAKAKELACAETMRWMMRMWASRLRTAFTQNVNLRTDAKKDADDDFELVKSWLSSESPVTFFEINQIKGTDPKKLEEASLDTLKDDNVINEYNLNPAAAAVVAARGFRRAPGRRGRVLPWLSAMRSFAVEAARAPRGRGRVCQAGQRAGRRAGARDRCASATMRTIWDRVVSSPTRVAAMISDPVPFTVPPVTGSPIVFSTGMGSPEIIDSSTFERPSITSPSTGTFSPGRTRKWSPVFTLSIETSSSPPSANMRTAVGGVSSRSARIAPEVALRARSSRTCPNKTRVMMTAAAS